MARVRIDCLEGLMRSQRWEAAVFVPTVDVRIWAAGVSRAWTWDGMRCAWSPLAGDTVTSF